MDKLSVAEDQHTEWKASWRDDYLKWICGFANAGGGVLVLGRDDEGRAVGLPNARRLLEELPNKVRDLLGIAVDVNLQREAGKETVEVHVEGHPNPINFKGEYYYRSGSTIQALRGAALDRFLLRKHGRTWDGAPLPGVAVKDLDVEALATFRRLARKSRRLAEGVLEESDHNLLEKLHLVAGDYLTRAATLIFHAEPWRFFGGSSVKIGYFENNVDLRYQDEIEGGLLLQVEQIVELLNTKYLRAWIRYEGLQRIEDRPVPVEALREAVLNAIVHKDYASGIPIQIGVHPDRLMIWNPGRLPEGWTVDKLLGKHASIPYNPDIAGVFFRAGLIESWGRGIERILTACREAGTPPPEIEIEETGLAMVFPFLPEHRTAVGEAEAGERWIERLGERLGDRLGERLGETERAVLLRIHSDPRISTRILAEEIGVSTTAIDKTLARLREKGLLRRVGPARGGRWEILDEQP
jgi:ATP-dependent DNA helicase RecG